MSKKVPVTKRLPNGVSTDDFFAFLPKHEYVFRPTRALWPAVSVDSALGKGAASALDQTKPIHATVWSPGDAEIVPDKVALKGGWRNHEGKNTYNLYVAPEPIGGGGDVTLWTDHGERLWGDYWPHILRWMAYKVQHPGRKINHCLVLGSGEQGIGKDAMLLPVRRAVGENNFAEVNVKQTLDPTHNGFIENVICLIGEVHDLGKNRFTFYDASKDWMCAPPTTITVSDKWIVAHPAFNVVGIIMTTNHKSDGLYLPASDRRHYVAWSDVTKADIGPDYFPALFAWYRDGGIEDVAHYLMTLDVSDFDPAAPPTQTAAFWEIVNASNATEEDAELADVLDRIGSKCLVGPRPEAVTLDWIDDVGAMTDHLHLVHDRRAMPHRMERSGYVAHRNPDAKDGLWKVTGRRQVVYVLASLDKQQREQAAKWFIEGGRDGQ